MIPKFRAWDIAKKKMWKVSSLNIEDEYVDLIKDNLYGDASWKRFSEIVLMQSTGLKDQNGVEIFDGDVVMVTDDDERTDFSDGGIGTVCGLEELYMWYIDGEVQNGLFDINRSYYIEVIGNVYENPELMEAHT